MVFVLYGWSFVQLLPLAIWKGVARFSYLESQGVPDRYENGLLDDRDGIPQTKREVGSHGLFVNIQKQQYYSAY